VLVALLCGACSSGPPVASAPQPYEVPASDIPRLDRAMPAQIDAFHRTEREVMTNAVGMIFRFRDTSSAILSVILYPATASDRGTVGTARARVDGEGRAFLEVLPLQVRRGVYESFEPLLARADSLSTGGGVPGYTVTARVRRRGRTYYELQHVHLIGGDFVKVRATVAEPGWPRPDLEHFDSTLVTALTHR
jgi:hypothetical protein